MKTDPLTLTPREIQVLKLISLGLTNGDIAVRLGLKLNTVVTMTGNIYSKLGVNNRRQATEKFKEIANV